MLEDGDICAQIVVQGGLKFVVSALSKCTDEHVSGACVN